MVEQCIATNQFDYLFLLDTQICPRKHPTLSSLAIERTPHPHTQDGLCVGTARRVGVTNHFLRTKDGRVETKTHTHIAQCAKKVRMSVYVMPERVCDGLVCARMLT
jgi:hypothetical protein